MLLLIVVLLLLCSIFASGSNCAEKFKRLMFSRELERGCVCSVEIT